MLKSFNKFLSIIEGNQDINWAVFGSFRLKLEGIKIMPSDIDILTTKQGAYQIAKLFHKYLISPPKFSKQENIKSIFFQLKINDIIYDIVGDLQNKIRTEWKSIPSLSYKKLLNKIPVIDLNHDLEVSIQLNDLKKVNLIKKILIRNNT